MKLKINALLAAALSLAIAFTACKKKDDVLTDVSEFAEQSQDQAFFGGEIDASANDLNDAISVSPSITGRTNNTATVLCGATIVIDSLSSPRSITITYNGANCLGTRTRTGVVKATIPTGVKWKDVGATLSITISNLKITRVSDGRSITINGTESIQNVSGGLLINLATVGSITHTINSTGLSITFDNGAQRSWQVAKKRVFSYSGGAVISTTGTYSNGTISGISEWGTTRFGNSFTTSIIDPIVVKESCNYRITSGKVKHDRLGTTTVTFGLNSSGAATGCPGTTGTYYMKVDWVGPAGATYTNIFPY